MKFLIASLIAGLLLVVPATRIVEAASPVIEIGTTRDANDGAQVMIADALGYFKANGLNVSVRFFSSGPELSNAVAAKAIQVASSGSVPATSLRAAGVPIVVLAQQSNISGVTKLVAQKAITSPEGLEGKKVGVILGSASEMLFDAVTQRLDIPENKITRVNLGPADMVTALIRGDISGGIVWEPWASEAVKGGLHTLLSGTTLFTGPSPKVMNFIGDHSLLFATKDWVERNPAATYEVLRALLQAQRVLQRDPDLASQAIAKELELRPEDVKPLLSDNVYSMAITPRLIDDMNGVATFLFRHGKLKSALKASDWVDPAPLSSVAPSLVTWRAP